MQRTWLVKRLHAVIGLLLPAAVLLSGSPVSATGGEVVVGSKKFTESYVLAEIATRTLEDAGFTVVHKQGMGATGIVWEALKSGQVSAYPDYTGTISEELLKAHGEMTPEAMQKALAPYGIGMTGDLGFNDTYALAMRREQAQRLGIKKISDLRQHPDLSVALTHEFLDRKDGWRPLSERYGLHMTNVRGVDHTLGYEALLAGQADVKDAYSTDAKLVDKRFVILEDDLGFFPKYKAVFLYRQDTPAKAVTALRSLEGKIDERMMVTLNAEAEKTKNYASAAGLFFKLSGGRQRETRAESLAAEEAGWIGQHLRLVAISLLFAILLGVPLGIMASRPGLASQLILGIAGVIQTIPSLALLAFLVPIHYLGITERTAIVALFLYSLLPIIRNTATGLQSIPPSIRESAAALGLNNAARMRKVFLPLASPTILAGIKTAAVINVGTATLAALIGAGGLGEPIVSGLNLNDPRTIMKGAIPAAILALLVQVLFEILDRLLIPRGLRLRAATER
jgi:osmoprotectant transport system permease protein